VQLKEIDKLNFILTREKNLFFEKYKNLEEIHMKTEFELETLKFKHANVCRDFMDCIVKMNIAIQAKQQVEYTNGRLHEQISAQTKQNEILCEEHLIQEKTHKRLLNINHSLQTELV